jgi:hypothetical protein
MFVLNVESGISSNANTSQGQKAAQYPQYTHNLGLYFDWSPKRSRQMDRLQRNYDTPRTIQGEVRTPHLHG